MLLLGGAVVDDGLFLGGEVAEGDVGAHAHGAADIGHQRPHEGVPGGDGALVDGEALVGDKGGAVDRADLAGALATGAGSAAIEGEVLGTRRLEGDAARGADERALGGDVQRGGHSVAVGATVLGQTREHQAQAVEQFRAGAEGGADARDAGALAQGQRGGDVERLVDFGAGGLGQTAPGVGGEGLEVTSRPLRVEDAEGKRALAAAGDSRHGDNLPQRHRDIDILEVVNACPADFHRLDHLCSFAAYCSIGTALPPRRSEQSNSVRGSFTAKTVLRGNPTDSIAPVGRAALGISTLSRP